MEFDVMVTWRKADGTTVDLPALVCFKPGEGNDSPEFRVQVVDFAIDMNQTDFPDDLGEGALPINIRFND